MTGKEHARLLGLFFWLLTGFQLAILVLIGLIYLVVFGAIFSTAPQNPNDPPPEVILGIIVAVMIFILAVTVLFSIPKVVAGYGLRNEKPWAKGWAIAACVMALMSAPFGTAVGIYGMIFLFGEQGKAYFDNPIYGQLETPRSFSTAPLPSSWK